MSEREALFAPGGPYADHVHICQFCGFRTALFSVLEAHFNGAADCDRKRLRKAIREAAAETDALRAALAFYADVDAYREAPSDDSVFPTPAEVITDGGQRAREALAGTPAEDRYAAGRLAGIREAAAVALAYEQKCDAEAEKHDWRKPEMTGNRDAMRIKEAWEERGESALVIRESIEALERVAEDGA